MSGKKLHSFGAPKSARKPVDEQAARAFVQDEQHDSRRRRATRGERIGVYLPVDVLRAVRIRCAEDGRSLSDGMTEAAREWLQRRA